MTRAGLTTAWLIGLAAAHTEPIKPLRFDIYAAANTPLRPTAWDAEAHGTHDVSFIVSTPCAP